MNSILKKLVVLIVFLIFPGCLSVTGGRKLSGDIIDKYLFAIYSRIYTKSVETEHTINMGEPGSKESKRKYQEFREITDLVTENIFLGKSIDEIENKYPKEYIDCFVALKMYFLKKGESY